MESRTKPGILIIDDEKSNLNVLNHTLRREYTVYVARDGKTGLILANEKMPDLILLDIVMPETDGYKVISELKASERTRDIPVIFVSGLVSDDDVKKGMSMGAADYIFKPFSAPEIKKKVAKHLIAL